MTRRPGHSGKPSTAVLLHGSPWACDVGRRGETVVVRHAFLVRYVTLALGLVSCLGFTLIGGEDGVAGWIMIAAGIGILAGAAVVWRWRVVVDDRGWRPTPGRTPIAWADMRRIVLFRGEERVSFALDRAGKRH